MEVPSWDVVLAFPFLWPYHVVVDDVVELSLIVELLASYFVASFDAGAYL